VIGKNSGYSAAPDLFLLGKLGKGRRRKLYEPASLLGVAQLLTVSWSDDLNVKVTFAKYFQI